MRAATGPGMGSGTGPDKVAGSDGAQAAGVEAFYTGAPFPGYAPGETAASLVGRSRRSPFLSAMDRAIDPSGRVLSIGCGTAHVPAFLAHASRRRRVLAIDRCAASLGVAERFRGRTGATGLQLVRGDVFTLPLRPGSFDVVSCRGVVHHTPKPWEAVRRVADCVAPGGHLIIGVYETFARSWHGVRQRLARLRSGRPVRILDPVLRRGGFDEERQRIWIADQYHHPLEQNMSIVRLQRELEPLGFEWIRTVPPLPEGGLFEPSPQPGPAAFAARRLGWMVSGLTDPDAGLVMLIARRSQRRAR